MQDPLAPAASRLLRWTRAAALAATAVVVLATIVHGWGLATSPAQQRILVSMQAVEVDGDYVAWTGAGQHRSHTSVRYIANGTPELLVLRQAQLSALLAGEPYETIERLPDPFLTGGPQSIGSADVRPPAMDCPPPTGGCVDATAPVLVWVEGTAWRGATLADATGYVVTGPGWQGPPPIGERPGPVQPTVAESDANVMDGAPIVLGIALAGGLVGILAFSVYAYASWRAPVVRRAGPLVPAAGTTEERLALVRLAALYVDGIRRSYRTSLATILAITAALLFFALPPMLDAVVRQFPMMAQMQEAHVALFILVPLDVMALALGLWTVSYLRVRRELAGWHGAARAVEEDAARILGA